MIIPDPRGGLVLAHGLDPSGNPKEIQVDTQGNLKLALPLTLKEDGGALTFADMPVSAAPLGAEESYSFNIDGNPILKIYAESNGAGGIQNIRAEVLGRIKITGGSPGAGKVLMSDATGLASWGEVSTFTTPAQPARALDTIYQNTSGKTMLVVVSVYCYSGLSNGYYGGARADIGVISPPNLIVARVRIVNVDGYYFAAFYSMSFIVPSGYYYRVASELNGNSNVYLSTWTEYT